MTVQKCDKSAVFACKNVINDQKEYSEGDMGVTRKTKKRIEEANQ